ncbi:hypothetical protein [Nocardiopsis aegyptia]|uniref:Uncharacterized protein n=1 Tax=Nocardiopsis aegyptia TaxID=220378 RepID=A0A7Z0J8H8_9ACTN|nr:hypothetical protein [Nocardiopsis aegyptia]NYJ33001.1 hypothetical protein [Nocardiopsis aegyptia]
MPRRPPGRLRAETTIPRRPHDPALPQPKIKGLSWRTAEQIAWLEHRSPHLSPAMTHQALLVWRHFVLTHHHRSWVPPDSPGCGVWGCCFKPRHARSILYRVAHDLGGVPGRELRTLLRRLDRLL